MKACRALGLALVLTALALVAAWRVPPLSAGPAPDAPLQNRSAPRSACRALVGEALAPEAPRVCDTPEVTVTMAVTCPALLPVHLVIAVDRSKSIADPSVSQILRQIQQSVRQVVDEIDFDAHPENKVAVLSHGFRVTTESELSNQKSRVLGAVNGIRYLASDLGEDPGLAVDTARDMLERERGTASPIEIILLYGDGCDPSVSGCESAAKRAAARAEGMGMAVMAVCYKDSDRETCATSYRQMVSQSNFYFETNAGQLPARVTGLIDQGKSLSVGAVTLLERLGAGFDLVAGSGAPPPQVNGRDLAFALGAVAPGQSALARYRVAPRAEGAAPLRANGSGVTLVDSLNRESDLYPVPPREVRVDPCVVATPTPSASPSPEPSATPSPLPTATTPAETATPNPTRPPTATRTATASPTPETVAVYLPIVQRRVCKPAEIHTDVALVIDASSSMAEPAGSRRKIDAAKDAARSFIGLLKLVPAGAGDQAAVLSFNAAAKLERGLGTDRAALEAAIAGIELAQGTRIDLAIWAAWRELSDGPTRPGNNRAIILLTDGRPDPGTEDAVLRAADELRSAAVIFTIGLGADIDAVLLRRVASRPDMYFEAPATDDLEAIYRQIAGSLPCPGGEIWSAGQAPTRPIARRPAR